MKKHLYLLPKLIVFLLLCLFQPTYGQKGFDQKRNSPSDKSISAPQGNFTEINGEKANKNGLQTLVSPTLSTKLTKFKVSKDPETGAILMIENLSKSKPNAKVSMQTLANNFLNEAKTILQIENPAQELEMMSMEADEVGMTHIKIQQKYKNIPIYGGEVWLHSSGDKIDVLNGRNFPTPKLNSILPNFSEEKAIEFAMKDVSKYAIVQQKGIMGKLLGKEGNKAELIIYHPKENADNERLTYQLTIKPNILERWVYFVDAQSGEILDKYNFTCSLDGTFTAKANDLNNIQRTFNVYQAGNAYYMLDTQRPMYNKTSSKLPDDPIGAIWTIDAKNSTVDNTKFEQVVSNNNNNWSPTAVSAHYNAGVSYDYYRTKFQRNSLDGKGSSIVSVVNITDEDGKGFDNAFWNGEFMGYGNGAKAFKPLAGGLDVAGHEMTHGVVEATARLEYRNQSGALNESFADIFGALIDRDDWTLGEDVVIKSVFPTGAMRSLENPNQGLAKNGNGYQPKTMSQYQYLPDTEDGDNGGVHVNSGVPNYAFYLFANNTNVGKDRAEQVYYRALSKYLTRTSKFIDARLAVIRASIDLYGDNTPVVNAAKAAFDAVGVVDPTGGTTGGTTTKQEIPVNNGGDYIIVFEPTTGKLYTSKVGTELKPITSSGCEGKPSVTDDGLFAYFVGKDLNIRRVSLVSPFTETKLTSDAVWGNVAVSKDGKRLAARAKKEEKIIYIFNLEDGKSAKFTLFNPTYSAGVKTGEVLFPDALEWDYTGEHLVYDAKNSLKSISGNLEYWDVGILRAWDLSKKTFGNGQIEKLFTDLEEGESIGNPSFAKTSPNIIVFDYYDEINDPNNYQILSVDIEEGDLTETFYKNGKDIAYPTYSRDDKLILFNSKKGTEEIVKFLNVKTDKINYNGLQNSTIGDAKWAVWYSQGQRALPTKTDQTINFPVITDKFGNQAFTITATASSNLPIQYSLESGDATISGNRITTGTTAGKITIKAFQIGNNQFNSASANQTFCVTPVTPTIAKSGENLVASGGVNYQWYVNGNPIGGQTTSNSRAPDLTGNWTVRSITSDGCQSAVSNQFSVVIAVLANEPKDDLKINFYPNPTSDELKIDLPVGTIFREAKIYSLDGKEITKFNKISDVNTLNISMLQKGNYTISIETNKGKVSRRIVFE